MVVVFTTTYALFVCLVVFSATFNNISVISWLTVLLVEDPEKLADLSQVTNKLYRITEILLKVVLNIISFPIKLGIHEQAVKC
jgi:predicted amino acid racemase